MGELKAMMSAADYADFKEQIKKEVTLEIMQSKTKHPTWSAVHRHFMKEMLNIEKMNNPDAWRIYEAIRNLIRFTFGIGRVENLPEEKYQAAISFIDTVIAAVKKARA